LISKAVFLVILLKNEQPAVESSLNLQQEKCLKIVHNFNSFQYSLNSMTKCLIAKVVILSLFFIFPHTVSCKHNFVK